VFGKLESVVAKYEELTRLLSDPEVHSNQQDFMRYSKEQSDISEIVEKYREYQEVDKGIAEAEEIINDKKSDADFRELAQVELADSRRKEELERI
jgi:peptide chain release factor 1